MKKQQLNSKGFGLIAAVIVIAVLVVLGGAGAYVYHRDHKAKPATTSSTTGVASAQNKSTNTTASSQSADPTAGWITYTSTSGQFSLKYPKTWATAANLNQCQDGIFLLGADSKSVGTCGGNTPGQMTITWQPVRTSCGLDSSGWTINATQAVTVSGVSGTETTGTAKVGDSIPEGTTTEQYCFVRNGTMYIADYNQLATYPDVLSDFNLMVTKTLTFN